MTFRTLISQGILYRASSKQFKLLTRAMSSSTSSSNYNFETLAVTTPKSFVYHVELNRPEKLNTMNKTMWKDIGACFSRLAEDPDCRSIVLSGSGKLFSAGLDFVEAGELAATSMNTELDVARKCKALHKTVREFQEHFSSLEKCPKPVIAAIHSACIGGAVDLICSADIRYCTQDAWFQIKEVDLGLAADVGTLQRLPKIIGSASLMRELAYTARKLYSDEAVKCGLVSRVLSDKERMMKIALQTAELIASKSPVAVQGTKVHINYSRDHPVQESLEYQALWNMTMLQSEDLMRAAMATIDKNAGPPNFSKL